MNEKTDGNISLRKFVSWALISPIDFLALGHLLVLLVVANLISHVWNMPKTIIGIMLRFLKTMRVFSIQDS